ncbi:MAG: hypothetical protein AAB802_03070, partial [Patescibacteria group bacterium]
MSDKNAETLTAIDLGYGDSDVYRFGDDKSQRVEKKYRADRMVNTLRKYLDPSFRESVLVFQYLKPELALLEQIEEEEMDQIHLPAIIEHYRENTLRVMEELKEKPDLYRSKLSRKNLRSVSFEIHPQGQTVFRDEEQRLSVRGQNLIPGRTLEQILNVPDSEKREQAETESGLQDRLPRAFSHQWFVDEILVRFHQVLLR